MRIAFVHSFYSSSSSGENATVEAEIRALGRAGHEVTLVAAAGDANAGHVSSLRAACRVATGHGRTPVRQLRAIDPDVVHVHNLFPSWGTRWMATSKTPIVTTLHNYRGMCANGLLLREGRMCCECQRGSPFAGIRHGCYRGSRLATAPLTVAQIARGLRDPYFAAPRLLFAPSARAAAIFCDAGIDPHRVRVHEPFVPDEIGRPEIPVALLDEPREGVVYVGRLSVEKGLQDVLPRWPVEVPLTVVGDGPMRAELEALAPPSVRFVGSLERRATIAVLKRAFAAIFPSRAIETFGLVYIEALAAGTPVIARRGTVISELVEVEKTGAVVGSWDELSMNLDLLRDGRRFREHCQNTFRARYSECAWLRRAELLYRAALAPDGVLSGC